MKKIHYLPAFSTLLLPLITNAAEITDVSSAGKKIIDIINGTLVPVLFAIAFVVFLWGAFKTFILGTSDEKARTGGKMQMLYALIGFFVMMSVWGLVSIISNTFQVSGSESPSLPTTPIGGR